MEKGGRTLRRPSPALERLLGQVFDRHWEVQDPAVHAERRREFVFHMTDWLTDLEELNDLFNRPETADPEAASNAVGGFLYHVIPHLNAAGRLLLGHVPDAFAAETEPTSDESKD